MLRASSMLRTSKDSRSTPPSATRKAAYIWLLGRPPTGSFSDECSSSHLCSSRKEQVRNSPGRTLMSPAPPEASPDVASARHSKKSGCHCICLKGFCLGSTARPTSISSGSCCCHFLGSLQAWHDDTPCDERTTSTGPTSHADVSWAAYLPWHSPHPKVSAKPCVAFCTWGRSFASPA